MDRSDDTFGWLTEYGDMLYGSNDIVEAKTVYCLAEEHWERMHDIHKQKSLIKLFYFKIKLNKNTIYLQSTLNTSNEEQVKWIAGKFKQSINELQEFVKNETDAAHAYLLLARFHNNRANALSILFQITDDRNYIKKALIEIDKAINVFIEYEQTIPNATEEISNCIAAQQMLGQLALKK